MNEVETMRGGSILRYCSTCKNNMWHKIDMCGKCGTTNTTKHKERCRCCGGLFDSLVCDHPGLQGQCETCVENYEKEKQDMSSDQYACAGCEKYFHKLDMHKDHEDNLLCPKCTADYGAGRTPKKETDHRIPMPPVKPCREPEMCKDCGVAPVDPPPRCGACWNKWHQDSSDAIKKKFAAKNSPSISPEKTGSPGPDDSHYHKGRMDPWKFIEANAMSFFEGSVIKYVTRWKHKNGIEDLRKARVYIDELIRQAQSEIEAKIEAAEK